jgi:4-alpha-glucanotransferase
MIESLWASPAGWTLAPLQDVLDLGGSARMNYPGRALGNWMWRAEAGNLRQGVAESLRTLNETHGRLRAA